MNPRLLDGGMNILRRLEPLSVSLDLNLEPLSSAEMQLRPGDGIPDRSWVAVYTEAGLAGIFRSRPQQERYGERSTSVSLTHGAVELNDWLTGKSEEESSARADTVIRTIFNSYHGSVWALGTVEPTQYIVYSLSNSGVLDALVDVMEQLPGYMLTFDQSVTPWTVNVIARPGEVTAEGRLSRNIQSVEISPDDSNLCTRVYYGTGNAYIEDAAAVQAYGVVEYRMSESGYTDAQLRTMAQTYLDNHKVPKLSVRISAIDLSIITGEPLDQIRLGRKYRLTIPEDGVVIEQIICAIRYDDVFTGQPQITLASDPDTIITYLKQQRKSGRAGQSVKELEDKFKEFETWQTQTDEVIETHAAQFVDILGDGTNEGRLTVAETVIGQTASDAYIVAQAAGILLDQDGHPILDGQGHYQYDPNAADTTLISKLNVNATGISSLVSQTGAVSEIFDPEKQYSAGDKVIHRGVVYQFTANHQGQWTGTDVIEVQSLTSQISQNANGITSVVSQTGIITAEFDINGLYNAGDKVLYQGIPYVFTERYTGGGWNPAIVQRINPLQTQITQTQTEISSKVSQSDLNTTLSSYLLISAFGTELGTTLDNGTTTLAAKIITAVNKNTNTSEVTISATQVNLEGYVTASYIDTAKLIAESLVSANGYAGSISVSTTVTAGSVVADTYYFKDDPNNEEIHTRPVQLLSGDRNYISNISVLAIGTAEIMNLRHYHDIDIEEVTTGTNAGKIKVTIGEAVATSDTANHIDYFKIADTTAYQNGVASARNEIEIAGFTWDVQSADSATAAHGKTYSVRLQNVTLGYQTGVDQHDDPVYTTTRTYNQIGPQYITDVYNQGWTDGNNDGSASAGGISDTGAWAWDDDNEVISRVITANNGDEATIYLPTVTPSATPTYNPNTHKYSVDYGASALSHSLGSGTVYTGTEAYEAGQNSVKLAKSQSGGVTTISKATDGTGSDTATVTVTPGTVSVTPGTWNSTSKLLPIGGTGTVDVDGTTLNLTAGSASVSVTPGSVSVTHTWDSTNHQYTVSGTGNVAIGGTTGNLTTYNTPLVPTDAINYGKTLVEQRSATGLSDTITLASTDTGTSDHTAYVEYDDDTDDSISVRINASAVYTAGQNSVTAALVSISAVPSGSTSEALTSGGVYDLQRIVGGTAASHAYYTVPAGGGGTPRSVSSLGQISLTGSDIDTSTKYPTITYDDGETSNSIPISVDASTLYLTTYLRAKTDGYTQTTATALSPISVSASEYGSSVTKNVTVSYNEGNSTSLSILVNTASVQRRTAESLTQTIVLPASHTGTATISGNTVEYDDDSTSGGFPVVINASAVYQQGKADGAGQVVYGTITDLTQRLSAVYSEDDKEYTVYARASGVNLTNADNRYDAQLFVSGSAAYNHGKTDYTPTGVSFASTDIGDTTDYDNTKYYRGTVTARAVRNSNVLVSDNIELYMTAGGWSNNRKAVNIRVGSTTGNRIARFWVDAPSSSVNVDKPYIFNVEQGYIQAMVVVNGTTYYGSSIKLTNSQISSWGGPVS